MLHLRVSNITECRRFLSVRFGVHLRLARQRAIGHAEVDAWAARGGTESGRTNRIVENFQNASRQYGDNIFAMPSIYLSMHINAIYRSRRKLFLNFLLYGKPSPSGKSIHWERKLTLCPPTFVKRFPYRSAKCHCKR